MNKPMKAALLSGLVFPGVGQVYLKRYARGLIMMLLSMVLLIVIVVKVLAAALEAVGTLPVSGQPDMSAISNIAASSSAKIIGGLGLLFYPLLACWIVSIIDAYRAGKDGKD